MATKKKDLNLCIEINLLPAEFRRQKKDFSWILDRRVVWPVVAIIVFVFCIFLLFAYMNDSRQTLQNALASTKAEIEKEKPLLDKIKELDGKIAIITQKRNALKSIQVSKKRWVILFENISAILPPNMWLTALQQTSAYEMELRGTTYDFSEVAEYMVKLEKQVSIASVTLVTITNTKVEGEDAYTFTMKAKIREDLGLEESKE
ncbi:MAG: PilN domain-containing protein [Fibrobacteraceae bacterium]|jgi:type IV pilus assembly protein PilN|nr:PilN domain-containing protein [Fibrobacteraceae bacterium]MEE1275526.1 PilN domain-containing protein [Fibrobacteraceae bacterium]